MRYLPQHLVVAEDLAAGVRPASLSPDMTGVALPPSHHIRSLDIHFRSGRDPELDALGFPTAIAQNDHLTVRPRLDQDRITRVGSPPARQIRSPLDRPERQFLRASVVI